jgi:parvulin-like peptidyl-prolyl isomerase
MEKTRKNLIILLTAVFLSLSFSGCNTNGGTFANDGDTAINLGVETVTVGEIRYFVESMKAQIDSQSEQAKNEFWTTEKDGKTPEQIILDQAVEYATQLSVIATMAKESDVTVSTADVDKQISSQYTVDQVKALEKNYKISDAAFRLVEKKQLLAQKYAQTIISVNPRMQPAEEQLKALFSEKFYKAQHILKMTVTNDQNQTPLPQEEKDAKRKEIEEILAKVKEPKADFAAIMLEQSEDPGTQQQPEGYVFTEGEMVAEFYEATAALAENAISDIVETTYGYHIIKRLPIDMVNDYDNNEDIQNKVANNFQQNEYENIINEFKEKLTVTRNEDKIALIKVR